MIIENVKPNLADAVPNKEERKAELPGKKKPHERKLKKRGHKFKKRAEKAEATSTTQNVLAAHSGKPNVSEIP